MNIFHILWIVIIFIGAATKSYIAIEHQYIFGFLIGTLALTLLQIAKEIRKGK